MNGKRLASGKSGSSTSGQFPRRMPRWIADVKSTAFRRLNTGYRREEAVRAGWAEPRGRGGVLGLRPRVASIEFDFRHTTLGGSKP